MMCSILKKTLGLLIGMIVICLLGACNKPEPQEFASQFIQRLNANESVEEIIYLDIKDVALPLENSFTLAAAKHYAAVGKFRTDEFGTIESNSYLELKPSSFPFSFPVDIDKIRIDSCILSLKYVNYEGDSLFPTNISVYEVIDDRFVVNKDKIYNVNNNILIDNNQLGSYTKSIDKLLQDSFSDAFTKHNSVMRVSIDTNWAKKFVQEDNTTAYANDSAFMRFFKGFALLPSPNSEDNALLNFNLNDTSTRLLVYYSYDSASVGSTRINKLLKLQFSTSKCAFATEIKRDLSNSLVEAALNDEVNNNDIFLQTSPQGNCILVTMPDLSRIDTNAIIHSAEIILEEKDLPLNRFRKYIKPPQLYIDILDSVNSQRRPLPIGLSNNSYAFAPNVLTLDLLNGAYKSDSTYKGYKINITRYIQSVISKKNKVPINFKIWAPHQINYNISADERATFSISGFKNLAISGIHLYGDQPNNNKSIRLKIIYLR